ncbi:MAG TPA: CoA-binding protein [Spirochaetota bacterium]|nr:CoA-binding protein [Spirochaetota bacterium]HOD13158.1 CoA-binding protein [Spirochaetota bacterium]HPG49035.1 CoA-binding protein [Spirochaetota bacterium]HPN10503.1 CoA-binding protein [Spirochaetota bacterium]
MKNLDKMFYPESIAVVGATETKLKWSSMVLSNILDGGFAGKVYPVSPARDTVYGLKAYKSLIDIPGRVDLVFIATPAKTIMDVLEDCVKKEIRNIVVISSGFSEAGGDGIELEKKLIAYSQKHDLNVVGPNTMGLSNINWKLNGTGAHPRPEPGGISIIAQSGNVGNQIMLWAEIEGFGIGKFVGSGNEAVLKVEDYLEYFNADKNTSVILMYLEGVDDGRKFLDIAKSTSIKKPVIALKAGRTAGGSKAASSHTGAMAGSFQIFESVMRQTGIMMAMNPTELLELSAAFDGYPLPKGNRVGIVTLGGGWGVITADECEERGLVLPPLPEDIKLKLDKKLPPFWSRSNPVDLVGQPDAQLYIDAIELMVASEAFDSVIVLGLLGSAKFGVRPIQAAHRMGFITDEEIKLFNQGSAFVDKMLLDTIVKMMNTYDKPIYPVSLAKFPEDETMHSPDGSKYKVIVYRTPEMAVLCLSKQYLYSRYLQTRGNG